MTISGTNARLGMAKAKTDDMFKGLSVLRDEERKAKAASELKVAPSRWWTKTRRGLAAAGSHPTAAQRRRKTMTVSQGATIRYWKQRIDQ